MSIRNILLGNTCTWGENYLNIPKAGFAYSELPYVPADEGFTVSAVFEITTKPGATNNLYPVVYQADRFGIQIYGTSEFRCFIVDANGDSITLDTNYTYSVNTPYVIDLVVAPDSTSVYINGALSITEAVEWLNSDNINLIGLFSRPTNIAANGITNSGVYKMYALNFYDKPLSAAEIEQNYNTYVARFGLST